jgi:DNA-binding transcriptional MerR regulator
MGDGMMARLPVTDDELTVGQVAERYGVTVRTLHHYDQIGLLVPSGRTATGYRLYRHSDLERLATMVVYRRLGFPLDEVRQILDGGDPIEHLRRQRAAVSSRIDELRGLVRAIDRALESQMNDQPITSDDMAELFGEGYDEAVAEAEQRWGDTEAWQESTRRTADYTKADWQQIKTEADAIQADFLVAFTQSLPSTSEGAMEVAERHRQHIDRRFYPCDYNAHRGLADLYVSDPRFVANYDDAFDRPGLAIYVHDAIHANAARHQQGRPRS